jgi:CheY-like chemotaxis protein
MAKPSSPGSILVVDDDRAHRTMLSTLLGGSLRSRGPV